MFQVDEEDAFGSKGRHPPVRGQQGAGGGGTLPETSPPQKSSWEG